MTVLKAALLLFVLFYIVPLGISAALYKARSAGTDWRAADRSSAGLLPPASRNPGAVVRVYAAPTVRWRGIFAVHCWIVFKPEGAASYTRYDYTAWGDPIRMNGFAPDGRWFGQVPETVFAADGPSAAAMIPPIQKAVAEYAWSNQGDYRAWPGPNSNTFVAAIMEAVPAIGLTLPPNALGKDYPHDGRWLRPTPSRTGFRLSLGGYAGLTLAWVEGIEVNILGAVAGLDLRRPAIKLPGLGRIGMRGPEGTGNPPLPAEAG
ncbi:DUF3750 domain-containing protein [Roseomonas indoligenes]|uniref:DUF3750 domain-containing protein n=1 Tax=Roseomonas indoligenes TaxID=2820811 RepID=A0A940MYM9_9PROT|nr:DUF3750 domain-containing protein [Pararoseomonas indoligenes]MBP0494571.1 DUF3750 domain-containing protein [Pararoseomonas indoligenes]